VLLVSRKTRDLERRAETTRRRGRPAKFGRPGRVVALTLPEDAIRDLHRVHHDIGWAIVTLLEAARPLTALREQEDPPDVDLVEVGERRALIVINPEVFRILPGVTLIPFGGSRAILALDVGRGMSDLELAVIDRLGDAAVGARERRALLTLRTQLVTWRHDQRVRFHTRSIIVIEQLRKTPVESGHGGGARRPDARRSTTAPAWPRRPNKALADDPRVDLTPAMPLAASLRRVGAAS
jgi:hypothetical protein